MNERTDINIIVNYILRNISATNKKLQKLVYYAYAWYIVLNNDNDNIVNVLFHEQPEAWVHGPVFPTIYEKYKENGRDEIAKPNVILEIDNDLSSFLDEILKVFGPFDGDQLELMTHNELPWQKARGNAKSDEISTNLIDLKDIYNYYTSLANE